MGAFGLGTIHLGDGGEAKGGSVAKTLIQEAGVGLSAAIHGIGTRQPSRPFS